VALFTIAKAVATFINDIILAETDIVRNVRILRLKIGLINNKLS
jgi:hypothetical protein